MSHYYSKPQKSRREKIGFYTAFAICLVAVCMAVYSTYNSVAQPQSKPVSTVETGVVAVGEPLTNVTVPLPEKETQPAFDYTVPTETSEPDTLPAQTQEATEATKAAVRKDALETMLSAEVGLGLPTESGHVLREYSKDSVYFKTINAWKPHTGTDFDGELGDKVLSMTAGEVTKVKDDKLYGKTVEITVNNVTAGYSGLGEVSVKQGDKVKRGEQLGTIGAVPAEADEKPHVHVYVRVSGNYADPLSLMENNDE